MAYLPELPEWTAGVYQLEKSDPVRGGVDGPANRPLIDLLKRTAWLKQRYEEAFSGLAGLNWGMGCGAGGYNAITNRSLPGLLVSLWRSLPHTITGASPSLDDKDNWFNVGNDVSLRANLGSSEEGQGAWLIAYLAGDSAVARTVAARLRDFVSLHDYWSRPMALICSGTEQSAVCFSACSDPTRKALFKIDRFPYLWHQAYRPWPNCILSSPDAVSASGRKCLPCSELQVRLILSRDLVIEGGCNAGVTSKRAIRGVRFINCTDIRMINCEVSRTGDWATSFEKCTDVSVVNYRHRKSGGTLYGGRDGIHFLDCVNFTLNGADIESGDDMVGCTTETRDQRNAVIRTSLAIPCSHLALSSMRREPQPFNRRYSG
ncbi:hypothetical protein [Klebsiella michiganensis]|uniref:hypothetical protein n=1 Tax=Klebsiella michiganensis TaxID=1134687 RepID=UPI001239E456|nr:hypothetical protein [Klebsiella michiganensis]QET52225.1 hypothetical protein FOB55_29775 [Klebsiella michiganensis]